MNKKKKDDLFFRTNYQIKSQTVRLVGDNVNVDIYTTKEALELANEMGLDLIEINPKSDPPICKIQEYGKFLYDKKKKLKELEKRNRQNQVDIKELRFGPNTDEHDFNFKKKHAEEFLKKGDKVKAYVFFKGRELQHKEKGEIMLLRLADDLENVCTVEKLPKLEGNRMTMMIKPKK